MLHTINIMSKEYIEINNKFNYNDLILSLVVTNTTKCKVIDNGIKYELYLRKSNPYHMYILDKIEPSSKIRLIRNQRKNVRNNFFWKDCDDFHMVEMTTKEKTNVCHQGEALLWWFGKIHYKFNNNPEVLIKAIDDIDITLPVLFNKRQDIINKRFIFINDFNIKMNEVPVGNGKIKYTKIHLSGNTDSFYKLSRYMDNIGYPMQSIMYNQ